MRELRRSRSCRSFQSGGAGDPKTLSRKIQGGAKEGGQPPTSPLPRTSPTANLAGDIGRAILCPTRVRRDHGLPRTTAPACGRETVLTPGRIENHTHELPKRPGPSDGEPGPSLHLVRTSAASLHPSALAECDLPGGPQHRRNQRRSPMDAASEERAHLLHTS